MGAGEELTGGGSAALFAVFSNVVSSNPLRRMCSYDSCVRDERHAEAGCLCKKRGELLIFYSFRMKRFCCVMLTPKNDSQTAKDADREKRIHSRGLTLAPTQPAERASLSRSRLNRSKSRLPYHNPSPSSCDGVQVGGWEVQYSTSAAV